MAIVEKIKSEIEDIKRKLSQETNPAVLSVLKERLAKLESHKEEAVEITSGRRNRMFKTSENSKK